MITDSIAFTESNTDAMLLKRGDNPHRPCLENRVAYQWEHEGDLLGGYNGSKKNRLTLDWLASVLREKTGSRAVLDVGCAYGNMLLMLNAKLEKDQNIRMVGVDLHPEGMSYAQAFSEKMVEYRNCEYQVADLSTGLPFDDETFDVVNLGDVLEHMEDPDGTIVELMRVTKPGGAILISTPFKGGLFKSLASIGNKLTGGRLYKNYYRGKDTELDANGQPMMITKVGHDHISEMKWPELKALIERNGLAVEKYEMMPVMSGSRWFDRHLFILSFLILIEAIHSVLKFPSWAHSVFLLARKPGV